MEDAQKEISEINKEIERLIKLKAEILKQLIIKCERCNLTFATKKEYGHHCNTNKHHHNKFKTYMF